MSPSSSPLLSVEGLSKRFTMHLRDGLVIPVVDGVSFSVHAGECVVLGGPSGAGKSSILKMIFGNYRTDAGSIWIEGPDGPVDLAAAQPREILALRRTTIGYVSQFLRAIPRVPALEIVMEPLMAQGVAETEAADRARSLLTALNVPERLWSLPPATFSGGEQQRVNIARGFIANHPMLLLDEPTASLDSRNREAVIGLIEAKKRAGTAILGIFHDDDVREKVADRVIDVTRFAARAVAA
ncbi:MAG: phosphonate C-P lyase system protein PhnL [Labrys sp. (in: a-proteobacteria)]